MQKNSGSIIEVTYMMFIFSYFCSVFTYLGCAFIPYSAPLSPLPPPLSQSDLLHFYPLLPPKIYSVITRQPRIEIYTRKLFQTVQPSSQPFKELA